MILKSVFIIAIVVVAMIGVMIPNGFAETVSNNIGSATIDENSYQSTQWGNVAIIVYGFIENEETCTTVVFYHGMLVCRGEIIVSTHYNPLYSDSPPDESNPTFFLVEHDGSFTREIYLRGSGVHNISVSYGGDDIGILEINPRQYLAEQKAAEQRAAEQRAAEQQRAAEWKAFEKKAAEKKAAEQRAVEKKAAEKKAAELAEKEKQWNEALAEKKAAEKKAAEKKAAEKKAAEKKAAEKRALEQRTSEARVAEAAIRAAEAKASQDLTNLLIITIAIASISLVITLAKRKKKKPTANTSQPTKTSTYSPPNTPTNTESSTMFFYECPKCYSADIQNNPDGSVNCPDCGYRG